MNQVEFEVEFLRKRLKIYEALLIKSYELIFEGHKNIKERQKELEKYRQKLKDYSLATGDRNAHGNRNEQGLNLIN